MPDKKDVSGRFDGVDDMPPLKLLCRGYIKSVDVHQSHQEMRCLDSADRVILPAGGGMSMDLHVGVIRMDSETAREMSKLGAVEILIRRVK